MRVFIVKNNYMMIKEAREALNGYFRENIFTSYINGNDLPYEHNNKLFLKR
ncbi:transposase [Staphylococcus aureus]|nr:transposase [Staphylococcus aureus]